MSQMVLKDFDSLFLGRESYLMFVTNFEVH